MIYLHRLIISFVHNRKQSVFIGLFYTFALLFCFMIQSIAFQQYLDRTFNIGGRLRTALMSYVYKKVGLIRVCFLMVRFTYMIFFCQSLKLKNISKEATVGQIVNLMSINANHFVEFANNLNIALILTIQIILGIVYLWIKLGPSALAGLVVMVGTIPINSFLTSKTRKYQVIKQNIQDDRIKITNDILNGIKVSISQYGNFSKRPSTISLSFSSYFLGNQVQCIRNFIQEHRSKDKKSRDEALHEIVDSERRLQFNMDTGAVFGKLKLYYHFIFLGL